MNKVVGLAGPATLAIVSLHSEGLAPGTATYKALDYLLDGLLTSSGQLTSNQVLVGRNFGNPLFVYLAQGVDRKQWMSFVELLKKDVRAESEILVIDEVQGFEDLKKMTPPDLHARFRVK